MLAPSFLLPWRLTVIAPLLLAAGGFQAPALAQTAARHMPADAIAFVEVTSLAPVIRSLRDSDYLASVLAIPQYQQLKQEPGFGKVEAARKLVEVQLGDDAWSLAEKLLGQQVALALLPGGEGEEANFIAYVQVADPALLAKLRERVEPLLQISGKSWQPDSEHPGVDVLELDGKLLVAVSENRNVASNLRERLNATLSSIAGKNPAPLSDAASFQLMEKQLGSEHLARVYVNTGALAETTGGRLGVPAKSDNPLISLLLGGVLELAVASPYAGAALDVTDLQFAITAGVAGNHQALGEPYKPFFANFPKSGTRPIPQPSGMIGGFTIYRDLASWYSHREDLLDEEVLPGFDKFETGLANLLPGKDFGHDVVPLFGQNVTFVAARQQYDHLDGMPGLQLPGFALIVEMADPEQGTEVLQLLFQTISLVLNLQAGQQGRQPWLLESDVHQGVKIQYGRYLEKPTGERLPLVFNFLPAAAQVKDRYIVSSSIGLCRALIDELQQPASQQVVNKNLNVEFSFAPFADMIDANQSYFQAEQIQKGRTQEEAEAEIAGIVRLLRYFQRVEFSTTVSPEKFQAHLKGSWQ